MRNLRCHKKRYECQAREMDVECDNQNDMSVGQRQYILSANQDFFLTTVKCHT